MHKLVYGVGINDSLDPVKKKLSNGKIWQCPIYARWINMLSRCYNKKNTANRFYEDVKVCDEWLTFSNFKAWIISQDWENKEVDKDLLGDGKIYSPESCCLISKQVNNHVRKKLDNSLPWGVRPITNRPGKYKAECNSLAGDKIYLGCYDSTKQAHKAWQLEKVKVLQQLALQQSDNRVSLRLQGIANTILADLEAGKETQNLKKIVDS